MLIKKITLNLIELLISKGFLVSTATNGSSVVGLEKEIAKKLGTYSTFEIAVSLESYKPEVHDKITNLPGSFNKAIKFLEELVNYVKNISVNTVVSDNNVFDLIEMAKFIKKKGVKIFSVTYPMPCYNTCNVAYKDNLISIEKFMSIINVLKN